MNQLPASQFKEMTAALRENAACTVMIECEPCYLLSPNTGEIIDPGEWHVKTIIEPPSGSLPGLVAIESIRGNLDSEAWAVSINSCAECCGDCSREISGDDMLTEINPPGGYGRMQFLVCDSCMRSGRWDHWIAEHWPNWPELST